jgi:hypothetical protein
MIIVRLMGGLGNQMFQYALGRHLALLHNTRLKMDLGDYADGADRRPDALAAFSRRFSLSHFNIEADVATDSEIQLLRDPYYRATFRDRMVRQIRRIRPGFLWNRSHVHERWLWFDPDVLKAPDNSYLFGFWQSFHYFEKNADILRRELTPADTAVFEQARRRLQSLRAKDRQIVAVHIRRGDLAHAHEQSGLKSLVPGAPVGVDYVERAISQYPPTCRFLFFSDTARDVEWCKTHFQAGNYSFSEAHTDIEDFVLMMLCDHQIISNSTFSWWAAWLNPNAGKKITAPRQWFYASEENERRLADLLPKEWVVT